MRLLLTIAVLALLVGGCGGSKKKSRPAPAPVDYSAVRGTWDATCVVGPVGSVESFSATTTGHITGFSAWGPFNGQLHGLGGDQFRCVNSGGVVLLLDMSGAGEATLTDGATVTEWTLVQTAPISNG